MPNYRRVLSVPDCGPPPPKGAPDEDRYAYAGKLTLAYARAAGILPENSTDDRRDIGTLRRSLDEFDAGRL